MGEYQRRMTKEIETAIQMQYSFLWPKSNAEVAGMLRTGILPNLLKIGEDARRDITSCIRDKRTREEALGTAWKEMYFSNSYEVMYFDLVDKIKEWFK